MKKGRHNYTPQEKVKILKFHLVDRRSVSYICDEYGLQPTVFYRWQKEFFEKGSSVFERARSSQLNSQGRKIEYLESKLQQKNEVLSELMEEHLNLKKNLGEL